MTVDLLCSELNKRILVELLQARNIDISTGSNFHIADKNFPVSENGITIVFDEKEINSLLDFLDSIQAQGTTRMNTILAGRKGESYNLININEINYFLADGNTVFCQSGDNRFEISKKLYEIEKEYIEAGFIRISKSYIINIIQVQEVYPWFGGRLLLKMKNRKEEIEVSRNYVREFKEFLGI